MCGLLRRPPASGRVAGFDLLPRTAGARSRLGYMAQKFSLYGDLSVAQNLEFFAGVYGLRGARKREQLERMIDVFALGDRLGMAAARAAAGVQAAPGAGLRGHARARGAVPRRADLGRRPADPPRVLDAHQRPGREGRHGDGHDPLPRRGRILRPHRAGLSRRAHRAGLARRAEGARRDARTPEPTLEDAFIALVEAREAERRPHDHARRAPCLASRARPPRSARWSARRRCRSCATRAAS